MRPEPETAHDPPTRRGAAGHQGRLVFPLPDNYRLVLPPGRLHRGGGGRRRSHIGFRNCPEDGEQQASTGEGRP